MKTNKKSLAISLLGSVVVAVASPAFGQTPVTIPPTGADRSETAYTPAENGFISQMNSVVANSKTRGALDVSAMTNVFRNASNAKASPEAVGAMVDSLVRAFPDSVATIVKAALAPANRAPSSQLVWNVMESAVMASPRPFSTVAVVRDTVHASVDYTDAPTFRDFVEYAAVRIASATPDNPLNDVTYRSERVGTELEQKGLAIKQRTKSFVGYGALWLDGDIGLSPFAVSPAGSSPGPVEQ